MRYLFIKVRKISRLVLELELYRNILKYVLQNLFFPLWIRQYAVLGLGSLSIQSSRSYLRNRCFYTGGGRWIINYFKASRMRLRVMAANGRLIGVTKSSW